MYQKKTLRRMHPVTRRYARILNELESSLRKLRNLTPELARLELDSRALFQQRKHEVRLPAPDTEEQEIDQWLSTLEDNDE